MDKTMNAQIKKVFLGIEEHGIFTFGLDLELETGFCKGYGGYSLEGPNCWKYLKKIIETVGVTDWKELEGKYIRVKYQNDDATKRINRIGHIIKERWFEIESKG